MAGKAKRCDILKNEAQMGLEYSDKTSGFELKLFSKASRNFFVDFAKMFKVSERFLT